MSAIHRRHLGPAAVLLAVALTATACGGGSSSAGASPTTSAAGTTSAGGTSPSAAAAAKSAGTTPSAAPATSAGSKTTTSAPSPTTTKIKATGGGDFCKNVANSLNGVGAAAAGAGSDPSSIKAIVAKSMAESKAVIAMSPAAIKPDMVVLLGVSTALDKALIAAHYDYTKLDPSALAGLSNAKVLAASKHVLAYMKTTCGIDALSGLSGK